MGNRPWRWRVRAMAVVVVVLCVGLLVGSAVAGAPAPVEGPGTPVATDAGDAPAATSNPTDGAESAATGPPGLTVVTTQRFYTGVRPGDLDVAELLAVDAAGHVVYHDTTYDAYFDVDPVPGTRATVEYVAVRRLGGEQCEVDPCSLNLVERLNLTTGTVTRVYDAVTPKWDTGRWHDVDRVNETHLAVADIVHDRVYVVDVRTGEITWQWRAADHYPITAGGGSGDWTHLNDVEVLADGRVMASPRNMDQVVFLRPGDGVVAGWTLGHDDDHEVLFEQHNPDYIPAVRGGPAVLVADSENNRVVEYRRADGTWTLAWSWRDRTLQWPRDADRLPNGHTLVADAHGDRVIEVGLDGHVVWSVEVGRPYDAERLGTGDESAGGYAAGSALDGSAGDGRPVGAPPATTQRPAAGDVVVAMKDALPGPLVNGLLFVAPPWFGFTDLLVAAALLGDLGVWLGAEWHWSGWSFRGRLRRLRGRFT